MTIRNWLRLFWSTLLAGTAASVAGGALLIAMFDDFTLMELSAPGFNWQTAVFIVLSGSTISVVSHVGFFSYLIARDIFLGFLRSKRLWEIVQVVFVAVAFEMMVYIRWKLYGLPGEGWVEYMLLPLALLIAASGLAHWKVQLTRGSAFIPTLFFIFVATVLEAVPAMKGNNISSMLFMMIPLVVSNAWQILTLPGYLKPKEERPKQPSPIQAH